MHTELAEGDVVEVSEGGNDDDDWDMLLNESVLLNVSNLSVLDEGEEGDCADEEAEVGDDGVCSDGEEGEDGSVTMSQVTRCCTGVPDSWKIMFSVRRRSKGNFNFIARNVASFVCSTIDLSAYVLNVKNVCVKVANTLFDAFKTNFLSFISDSTLGFSKMELEEDEFNVA